VIILLLLAVVALPANRGLLVATQFLAQLRLLAVVMVVVMSIMAVLAALAAAVVGTEAPVRGPAVKDTLEGTMILRTVSPAMALALAVEPLL
jgi:hypothetical protein